MSIHSSRLSEKTTERQRRPLVPADAVNFPRRPLLPRDIHRRMVPTPTTPPKPYRTAPRMRNQETLRHVLSILRTLRKMMGSTTLPRTKRSLRYDPRKRRIVRLVRVTPTRTLSEATLSLRLVIPRLSLAVEATRPELTSLFP